MSKKIEEIFKDYKTNSNIKYANIDALNVIKKTNTLQVQLTYDEYIEIKEIWYFEKFLKERFQFEHIDISIKYHEETILKEIDKEWKNIIAYMAHKYPLTKPMLLLKSDIEIIENEIKVKMHIRGAEFLKAKKTDKELEKVLKNLFGKEYKIQLIEELSKKDIQEIKQAIEQEEKQIISHIEEMNRQEKSNANNIPEYNDSDYMPPQELEGYIPEEGENQYVPELEENEKIQEYIIGKPSKAKENHVKIKDITANDGRVTLEGRIVTCQLRETKSGKGMIIFDIYDGTGVITCKSFSKDIAEGNDITSKMEEAKIVKIIGKAGLDTYAGDITVIANTIVRKQCSNSRNARRRGNTINFWK